MATNNTTVFEDDNLSEWEKYERKLLESPYASDMTDEELRIAAKSPTLGIRLIENKEAWYAAQTAGDAGAKNAAHASNETIRKMHRISEELDAERGYGETERFSPSSYVNAIYDAKRDSNLTALKSAYDKSVRDSESRREDALSGYGAARDRVSSAGEIGKYNLNEYAAASGLGTGARAALYGSAENARTAGLTALDRDAANTSAEYDRRLAELEAAYESNIAKEIAAGNAERAKDLYGALVKYYG